METREIRDLLERLEGDASLEGPTRFADRHAALAELGVVAELLGHRRAELEARELASRVAERRAALERADRELFAGLRDEIREGTLFGASLRAWLDPLTAYAARAERHAHVVEEPLDAFVDGMLGLPRVAETGIAPGDELIHYEPAPASVVLDLVDHGGLGAGDVVCDVGSGIGRIPLLLHLLTGTKTMGLELDSGLAAIGERAARGLELGGVELRTGDARTADFAGADVFVLVTPFKGRVLEDVLGRLRASCAPAPLRLVSFGPGTPWIARVPWLERVEGDPSDEFGLVRFVARA